MGNGFAHIELSTDDTAKAQKFYKAIFPSWKFKAMPKMSYTLLDTGVKGAAGGGVQKLQMPEQPKAWLPYVEVADVKKTVEKARKAGAHVLLDFMAMGDMGAIAIFADPTGAAIGIWGAAAKKKAAPKKKAAKKSAKKR